MAQASGPAAPNGLSDGSEGRAGPDVQPQDLAQHASHVLPAAQGVAAAPAVPGAGPQHAVRPERELPAVVVLEVLVVDGDEGAPRGRVGHLRVGGAAVELVDDHVPRPRRRRLPGGVVGVEAPALRVVRGERDRQQAALVLLRVGGLHQVADVEERGAAPHPVDQQPHGAPALDHVHVARVARRRHDVDGARERAHLGQGRGRLGGRRRECRERGEEGAGDQREKQRGPAHRREASGRMSKRRESGAGRHAGRNGAGVCPLRRPSVFWSACSWTPRTPSSRRAVSFGFVGSSPARGSLPTPTPGCAGPSQPRSPLRGGDPSMTADDTPPAPQDPAQRVRFFDTTLRDGEQAPRHPPQHAREGRDRPPARAPRRRRHRGRASRSARPATSRPSRRSPARSTGLIVAALARANERDVTVGWRGRARRASARASTRSSPPATST